MRADTLGAFKEISLKRKTISKLEKGISDLNNALNSLKEEHASLFKEHFNVSNTFVEKVVKIDCNTCPILKLKNKNLKRQLAQKVS